MVKSFHKPNLVQNLLNRIFSLKYISESYFTMIKALIFDLDGTLIESTKELHYEALNRALSEISTEFIISKKEHEEIYDALSTKQKLHLLTLNKGLNIEYHDVINKRKQEITFELLNNHDFNIDRAELFTDLKKEG